MLRLLLLAKLGLSRQRRTLEVVLLLDPAHAPARNVFPLSVAEVGGDRDLAVVVRLSLRPVVARQRRVVVVYRVRHQVAGDNYSFK